MKAGATERIVVHIDFTKEVDEVIFTLKGNATLTKSFTNDNDGTFLIDLSQEETEKLEGMFQIEAQINFEDGSVKKTNIESKYINSTLATEKVIGSHATDDSLDMLLEVIKGDIALIISPESSNELITAVSQLFLQTKAVADSVREDADSGKFDGKDGADGKDGKDGEPGQKGDKGDRGEQGIQGEKGEKGDKGEQGVAGADGKDGADGADGYTPQKGVDYYTSQEIQAMEADVVAVIGENYTRIWKGTSEPASTGMTGVKQGDFYFKIANSLVEKVYYAKFADQWYVNWKRLDVEVDSSLSDSSTNPVQNSVITQALALKVDKEAGKGLSTNDFTNAYKEVLDFRITKQPNDVYVTYNGTADVSVTAIGNNLTYQWQYSTDNGETWDNYYSYGYNTDTVTYQATFSGHLLRCKITDGDNNVIYSDAVQVLCDNSPATDEQIKLGGERYRTITPIRQHTSVFYAMAKAAGDTTQSQSSNPVGTYTDDAIIKILKMLGVEIIEESDYESLVTPEQKIYLITEDDV